MDTTNDIFIDVEGLTEDKQIVIEIKNLDLPEWSLDIINGLVELLNRQISPVQLDIDFT